MFMKYFLLSLFSWLCLGQLPELKVTYTDMSQSMRDYAVGQSLIMLSNGIDAKQLADKLVDIMNNKYGNGWFTLVGTNTAFKGLKTAKNTTLEMQYKDAKVTIAQQQKQSCNVTNFTDVIRRARSSQPVLVEYSGDKSLTNQLKQDIYSALSISNLESCDQTTIISNRMNWCFRLLSLDIYGRIVSNSSLSSRHIEVNSGLIGHHFSYGTGEPNLYMFTAGDLFIDIRLSN